MTISRERMRSALGTEAVYAHFGLRDGERDDDCPQLLRARVLNGSADASYDYLYIICEAVEPTARAAPIGANIMAAIRDAYAESDHHDPVAAIAAAVGTANDALYAKNRAGAPGLRVFLGVTCLVIRGDDLVICQAPPTQTIVAQNGTPVALPALESWLHDYQPRHDSQASALGMHAEFEPQLFRATLEQDDLITLCSSNLASLLAEEEWEALIGNDPIAARDFLADLADRYRLDPAYAAVFAPPSPDLGTLPGDLGKDSMLRQAGAAASPPYSYPDRPYEVGKWEADDDTAPITGASWFERGLREMRERSRVISWPRRKATITSRVVPLRDDIQLETAYDWQSTHDWDGDDRDHPGHAHSDALAEAAQSTNGLGHDSLVDYPTHYDADADWAATDDQNDDTDEPTAASRRARPRVDIGQSISGIMAFIVLLAGTVLERIRPAGRRAQRTSVLPRSRGVLWPIGSLERWGHRRGPRLGRWVPLVIVAAIVVVGLVLVTSVRNHQIRAAEEGFTAALYKVSSAREAALNSPDRAAARLQLLSLPGELDKIPTEGQPRWQEQVAAERASLALALDRVEGIERLGAAQVQLLAPAPASAGTSRPQIVIGGGQQFVLLNGTVYAIDGRAKTMTKVLAKGDDIGGTTISQVLGIAWRLDSLLAFDESYGYIRDEAGKWSALPLAASGRKVIAADTFDGNLYFLEADRGQIAKYASGSYASAPQPWSSTKVTGELALSVDMTIDKDIYVLLSDGRILDFFQGELKQTFTPGTVPGLAGASAISAVPDGKFLYVVDPKEGRIVRLGRDGNVNGVYKAAEGAPSFTGAREIAIDEAAGIAYVLTDEGLLSVRLPGVKP